MIIEDRNIREPYPSIKKYIDSGVISDSFVLTALFLDSYVKVHKEKRYLLKECKVERNQIDCLNEVLQRCKIKKLIVTPHVLTEFLNRLRRDIKSDHKEIKRENIREMEEMGEIEVSKNLLLKHKWFFDFGVDISMVIATEEQIKKNRYSAILSFDGRFINKFFRKNANVLAFNLEVLRWFY